MSVSRAEFLANVRAAQGKRRDDWIAGWCGWARFDARDEPGKGSQWRAGFDAAAAANERGGARPCSADAADEYTHREVSP